MNYLRFTLRDLFWLVLVTAILLGWLVRERQLQGELSDAARWRGRASALEFVLRDQGRAVKWKQQQVQVESGHGWDAYSTTLIPPSPDVGELD
jgi:hypothetical protein